MKRERNQENIIAQEIESKIDRIAGKDIKAFLAWQKNLEVRIQQKFPSSEERIKYRLYHALNGSTGEEGDCPYFDFPGDLSIQKAVDELTI